MCLGEVARVTELLAGRHARVSAGGRTVTVSLLTLEDDVGPGDWVVVHSGFALARLRPDAAAEAIELRSTAGGADDDEDVDTDTGVPGTVAHCCPHHLHADLADTGVPGTFAGAEVRS